MTSVSLQDIVDDAPPINDDNAILPIEVSTQPRDENTIRVQLQKAALFFKANFPDIADIHFPDIHINLVPPRLVMHQDDLDKFNKRERPVQSMIENDDDDDEHTTLRSTNKFQRTISLIADQNFQEVGIELEQGLKDFSGDVEQFFRDIVDLPHKIELKWRELCLLMILFAVGSAFLIMLPLFVPLNSVNDGLDGNLLFVYGVMTYYQFIFILPWVEFCNYAMPTARISLRARMGSVFIGVAIQKLFDAAVTESLWIPGAETIFPIPFSTIVSGTIALPFAIGSLYCMTQNLNDTIIRQKWGLCIVSLLVIVISIIAAALWAVGIQHFRENRWQKLWALTFGFFQWFFKFLLAGSAVQLNPYRFIPMQLVVDAIFTRFQVATFPHIDGPSLVFLLVGNVFTLFWRIYGGGDRLGILFCSYRKKIVNGDSILTNAIREDFGASNFLQVVVGITNASVSDIHRLNALNSNTALFQEWGNGDDLESDKQTANEDEDGEELYNQFSNLVVPHGMGRLECIKEESDEDISDLDDEDSMQDSRGDAKDQLGLCLCIDPPPNQDVLAVENEDDRRTPNEEQPLAEKNWEQRQLFHIVDFVGSEILSTMIILHNVLATFLARNLPIREHLNDTFDVPDERLKFGIIFGWVFIGANLLIIGCLTLVFRDLEKKEKTKWTMKRFISYIFGQNFWFLFLWLTATGTLSSVSFIKHFGADFTLQFEWLDCRGAGEMAWPGCSGGIL